MALSRFGDQAARLYSWASGIILILFSLALAKQLGLSNKGRVVLLAMIVSTTAILDLWETADRPCQQRACHGGCLLDGREFGATLGESLRADRISGGNGNGSATV